MARLTGKNLYVAFNNVALWGSGRSLDVTLEQETADATAGADDYRVFAKTVKNFSASLEIVYDDAAAGTAARGALALGAVGTLLWGPEGTTAGRPKWGALVTVTNASQTLPFDDVITISTEFQNAGSALLFDGATAVW